jgi:hypothetical protein
MGSSDEDIALLLAERSITRVLHRYAQGVDRYRMEQVRACYWNEATDSHQPHFVGGPDEYVRWLSEVLPALESISHQFTNILITAAPAAGTATVESYCLNAIVPRPGDDISSSRQLQCLRYLDQFEQRGNEWRILQREVLRDWTWFLASSAFVTKAPEPDTW